MTNSRYTSILVDGQNTLHRAAHSYSDLSILDGDDAVPTGAIFGFLQMVLSVWRRYAAPNCELTVCWDAGYDHRVALYPDYKANRRKPREPGEVPDHLMTMSAQGKALRKILKAAGWRQARASGFEADDVMATLSRQHAERGSTVLMYTGDKDLHQCVLDNAHVLSASKGKDTIWTPEAVLTHWGIPARRVPEAKALAGDGGDNIPGCPGCGDVWATKILQTGDLDDIIKRANQGLVINGTYQDKPFKTPALTKKIAENEGIIRTSWELAKVVYDCPVEVKVKTPDPDLLRRFLFRLRFHSLLEEETFKSMLNINEGVGVPEYVPQPPQDIDAMLGFL